MAAKGGVPIGIGKNSHIKRAIIDKNARIGDDVKVLPYLAPICIFLIVLLSNQCNTCLFFYGNLTSGFNRLLTATMCKKLQGKRKVIS